MKSPGTTYKSVNCAVARGLSYVLFMIMLLASSCKNGNKEQPLFELVENSGIDFQNTIMDTKTDNSFYFRNFYNGGGTAIGDINNDGLADVVLTSNMGDNKLFLNHGNWKFEDISERAGLRQDSMWSTGVVLADVNGDGWLDIYICNSGHINDNRRVNKLYLNNHDLSFTESAKAVGLDHSGYCTQASFFDYDMDGDLDCLIINNSPIPFGSLNYAGMRDLDIAKWNVKENLKGGGNHLYRNDHGHFTEVTKEAGLHTGLLSFGLGVSIADINGDGYPDIYVGNDFIERDYLYINQKNGTFSDQLEQHVQQISMSSMSTDIADINNDGYPDIFTTDMMPANDYRLKTTGTFDNIDLYQSKQKSGLYHQFVKNALQLNNKNNTFSEIAAFSGVMASDWSWGSVIFDADNDGYNDIFVCNGINKDLGDLDFLDFISNDIYKEMMQTGKKEEINEILKRIPGTALPNKIYRNDGNLRFTDIGNTWGFSTPSFSNSVAYGDLDNDGDLDLVVNNVNMPAFIYRNNSVAENHHHFIALSLQSTAANRFAIGAKIRIYAGKQVFYREVEPSRGFQSSMDYKQVVGLGADSLVDSLVITWPDRSSSTILHPKVNSLLGFDQTKMETVPPQADRPEKNARPALLSSASSQPFFRSMPAVFEPHRENDFIDFYTERNIPEMLSREGPRIASADVNGDGLQDLYIGGGKNQAGQLYVQTATGFVKKQEPVFDAFSNFEDVAVLFFDCDGDGDQDLFVGAGGNELAANSREMQHRLYINDGKGNFSIDTHAFPSNDMNISVAAANDFDGDGDQDLFIGGLSVPSAYGVSPRSYLYQNDGHGHFTDITMTVSPELAAIGMVSAAQWIDIDGDGRKELVLVGEWMAPRIFTVTAKTCTEIKDTHLQKLFGLWKSVASADLNGDGKPDLVLGNIGENFYFHPDDDHPVKMWLNDFDQNGTVEPFLTRSIDGRDMPVFLKREVTDQFPALKKQNLRHKDFATKSIQDLFTPALINGATVKQFNFCASVVAINNGNGKFTVRKLPARVQFSSLNSILCADVNNDNKADLVLGGNNFNFQPQFGRLDASYGEVLLNDGQGGFTCLDPSSSGLTITGEIKDIKLVSGLNKKFLLIARNNEMPGFYELNDLIKKEKY